MSDRNHAIGSQTATIASSGTTSGAITNKGVTALGIALPAAFTGTALTFQVSADGTTYQGLYAADGTAVAMTVAQGRSYALPAALAAWPYFKIVSGSSEGAARSIAVVSQT